MGQRNKQHMGRSTDEDRTLIGRDISDGDVIAEGAEHNYDFQPNEEGTEPGPEQAAERGSGQSAADQGAAGRGGADEARRDAGRDAEGRA